GDPWMLVRGLLFASVWAQRGRWWSGLRQGGSGSAAALDGREPGRQEGADVAGVDDQVVVEVGVVGAALDGGEPGGQEGGDVAGVDGAVAVAVGGADGRLARDA